MLLPVLLSALSARASGDQVVDIIDFERLHAHPTGNGIWQTIRSGSADRPKALVSLLIPIENGSCLRPTVLTASGASWDWAQSALQEAFEGADCGLKTEPGAHYRTTTLATFYLLYWTNYRLTPKTRAKLVPRVRKLLSRKELYSVSALDRTMERCDGKCSIHFLAAATFAYANSLHATGHALAADTWRNLGLRYALSLQDFRELASEEIERQFTLAYYRATQTRDLGKARYIVELAQRAHFSTPGMDRAQEHLEGWEKEAATRRAAIALKAPLVPDTVISRSRGVFSRGLASTEFQLLVDREQVDRAFLTCSNEDGEERIGEIPVNGRKRIESSVNWRNCTVTVIGEPGTLLEIREYPTEIQLADR